MLKKFHDHLFEGLEENTKVCGMCLVALPLTMFGTDGGSSYLRYECKPCAKKQSKLVNTIKKSAPAIPKNYQCPICLRNEEEAKGHNPNKKGVWCADHDHTTNQFRGWLCHKCNVILGMVNDNPKILANLIKYLNNV